jgi:hypothetical protein
MPMYFNRDVLFKWSNLVAKRSECLCFRGADVRYVSGGYLVYKGLTFLTHTFILFIDKKSEFNKRSYLGHSLLI